MFKASLSRSRDFEGCDLGATGEAAKPQPGVANNRQTPIGHLITVALEGRLCQGLSMSLGWFVYGLARPDCRSEEYWQLAEDHRGSHYTPVDACTRKQPAPV